MKPQKMLSLHNPTAGVYGDCMRTCIAAMLDMDAKDVPHFLRDGPYSVPETVWAEITEWLGARGLAYINIWMPIEVIPTFNELLIWASSLNPAIYYMVGGTSRGNDHFVIGCGGQMVMDPAHANLGLDGPDMQGNWHVVFFVPIVLKRRQ